MEKVKDVSNAKEYNIYSGLGGGFGGATYQYTGLFNSQEEATNEAYERACEEYDSYSGSHGLLTYEEAEEQAINEGYSPDTEDFEAYISEVFQEDIENWVDYYAILTSEDTETPEDDLIRDYIIVDGDSTREVSGEGD